MIIMHLSVLWKKNENIFFYHVLNLVKTKDEPLRWCESCGNSPYW